MKRAALALLTASLFGGLAQQAVAAGATATQTVAFQVTAINELSVSGNPAALVINSATAGSDPDSVSNSATTYAITTNEARKLTAVLDQAMPGGTTLSVNLTAPTGGASTGATTLTDVAANVLNSVVPVCQGGRTIAYTFAATAAAGVVAPGTRTVTFTIAAP